MYKQIFDIKPMHGIDIPLSNALLRKYSKGAYKALHTTNYDQSREKLDFEIVTGGKIIPFNNNWWHCRKNERASIWQSTC